MSYVGVAMDVIGGRPGEVFCDNAPVMSAADFDRHTAAGNWKNIRFVNTTWTVSTRVKDPCIDEMQQVRVVPVRVADTIQLHRVDVAVERKWAQHVTSNRTGTGACFVSDDRWTGHFFGMQEPKRIKDDGAMFSNWLSRDKTVKLIAGIAAGTPIEDLLGPVRLTIAQNKTHPFYFRNIKAVVHAKGKTRTIDLYDLADKKVFGQILGPIMCFNKFSGSNFASGAFPKSALDAQLAMHACLIREPSDDALEQLLQPEHDAFAAFLEGVQETLFALDDAGNNRRRVQAPMQDGEKGRKEQPIVKGPADGSLYRESKVPTISLYPFTLTPFQVTFKSSLTVKVIPTPMGPTSVASITEVIYDVCVDS